MFKSGFVGLIGLPNAGKSTLLNKYVGDKVAIVTPKPQTTRNRIIGLYSDAEMQVSLVDAPGAVRADKGLNRFLQKEFELVGSESDALLAVLNIDANEKQKLMDIIEWVVKQNKPWAAVITKIDLPHPDRVNALERVVKAMGSTSVTFSSRWTVEECREILNPLLKPLLPESPAPLYDTELYTTQNLRDMVAEWIRESCFVELYDEIPYGLAIQIRQYDESKPHIVKIVADIVVSKDNHKGIVIGEKGQALKRIGQKARVEIEKLVGKKVFLELMVRAKDNWPADKIAMKNLGYDLEMKE